MSAALRAASRYYELSGGVHIEESGVEHYVQAIIWEAICNEPGLPKCFATMETRPADILNWSGVSDHKAFFATLKNVDARSRFDLVFHVDDENSERPKGIVEVKIGRTSESFSHDLQRIYEFAERANGVGASIDYVAAIFVERGISEDELEKHKMFVERNLPNGKMPQWHSKSGIYADKHKERPNHNLMICVAAYSFGAS